MVQALPILRFALADVLSLCFCCGPRRRSVPMSARVAVLERHVVLPRGKATKEEASKPPAVPAFRALDYVLRSRSDQVGSCVVSTLCELAYCNASGFRALLPAEQTFDNVPGRGGIAVDFPIYQALRDFVPRCKDETGVIHGYKTIAEAGAALVSSGKLDLVTAYGKFVRGQLTDRLPLWRGDYLCVHVRLGDVEHAWPADSAYDRCHKYVAHWLTDVARDPLSRAAYDGYQDELAQLRGGRRPWGQVPMAVSAVVALVDEMQRRHAGLPVRVVGLVPADHALRSALPHAHFATGGSEWDDMMLLAGAKVLCLAHSYLGFVGALLSDPAHTEVYYPMNAMYACLGLGSVVDRSGWCAVDSSGAVVDADDWQLWRR